MQTFNTPTLQAFRIKRNCSAFQEPLKYTPAITDKFVDKGYNKKKKPSKYKLKEQSIWKD